MTEEPLRKPPPPGDHEPPPKPKRYWWRFTLASVLIVTATAAATASSILLYVGDIANALSHNDRLRNRVERILAQTRGGEPQNILILGSDRRTATNPGDPGRSDTTILLRLDPDRNAIALMSIPRDLKVEIPGVGTDRFAAAYAYGGPKLALRVVRELTGLRINHIVNVDFLGFVRAVDAIGCVYVDVDRRYFHSNEGVPPSEQYAEIDVPPGYQLLCGEEALQYVRFRHTDTDLVRAARQQDFLSAARQRVPVSKLVLGRDDLIDIFTSHTTSDISDTEAMLEVMKLFVASRNATINEVNFPATLGPSYVYATQSDIREAVTRFLGIEASGGPRGELEEAGGEAGRTKAKRRRRRAKPRLEVKPPGDDGLVEAGESGVLEAKTVTPQVGHGFGVFYPTRLPPGAGYVESNSYLRIEDPYVYHLPDTDGDPHGAYRMVLSMDLPDGTHYFGVQGLNDWEDPPILGNPSVTETIGGREYEVFLDGDRIKRVAWHRGDDTYWISNSLLRVLTNDQMLGMARSAQSIVPNPKPPRTRRAIREEMRDGDEDDGEEEL